MAQHRVEIFECDLNVCWKLKQWRKLQRRIEGLGDVTGLAFTSIDVYSEGFGYEVSIYIDVKAHHNQSNLVATVAHEASHAARFILNHIGETERTHEVESYLVDFVAGRIWQSIKDVSSFG